jgi:hypothetical protein
MTPDPPAGGAPVADVVAFLLLSAAGLVQLGALTRWFRQGDAQWLRRAAEAVGRFLGLPVWAGLPLVVTLVSLTASLHGFYWDVAIHIDEGRDASVFANPAHWMVAGGLIGTFLGGALSVIIGTGSPTPSSIRIADGWHAPAMGVVVTVCGVIAFLGFPLDDIWHRIAGQDVALWGPMHLIDVGGSSLAGIAMWGLLVEAGVAHPELRATRWFRILNLMFTGALLQVLTDFQAEFDFGAPNFALTFHPLLVAFAAGGALVAARIAIGPGGALVAVGSYVVIRTSVALFVGEIFDLTAPLFPLYLGSAILVEVIALVGFRRQRGLAWGASVGAVVGTVGLLLERVWVNRAMRVEWPDSMITEAVVLGLLAGAAGGVLGVALGRILGLPRDGPLRLPALPLAGAAAVLVALVAYLAPRTGPDGVTASVELRPTGDPATRTALVDIEPAGAADDARWFMIEAFRGGGHHVVPLERVGSGQYRSTDEFPVGDEWNTLIRLHVGRQMLALPISQPYDDAIPAPAVEAEDEFTRTFVADRAVVQRESVGLNPGAERAAYAISAVFSAAMLWAFVVGLRRLGRIGQPRPQPEPVEASESR